VPNVGEIKVGIAVTNSIFKTAVKGCLPKEGCTCEDQWTGRPREKGVWGVLQEIVTDLSVMTAVTAGDPDVSRVMGIDGLMD
jgi:hypothetical protein